MWRCGLQNVSAPNGAQGDAGHGPGEGSQRVGQIQKTLGIGRAEVAIGNVPPAVKSALRNFNYPGLLGSDFLRIGTGPRLPTDDGTLRMKSTE